MSDKIESHIELQFREPGRLQWLGAFYGNEESAWAAADYHRKKYPNDEVRVVRITTEVPDRPDDKNHDLTNDIEDIRKRLESIEGILAHVDEKPSIDSDSMRHIVRFLPCGSVDEAEALRRLEALREAEKA